MKRLVVSLCLLLAGCGEPLTNAQIIAEVKECKAAGLIAYEHENWRFETTEVQCVQPLAG